MINQLQMDEDIDVCSQYSAERKSVDGEAAVESDSTYLGVLPSVETLNRSQFFPPEADEDGSTYEQVLDSQDNTKPKGFNGANPLSKLFWWWVISSGSLFIHSWNMYTPVLVCVDQ